MKILFATHNLAKLRRYKNILRDITNLHLVSLKEVQINDKVPEPYSTALENAEFKAKEYAKLAHIPTLAVDEAVTTNFLPNNEQPGVYVRRFANKETAMSDEELLYMWSEIFKKYPQEDKQFIWDYSIAYYNPATNKLFSTKVIMYSTVAKVFSSNRQKGYPMSSFLIHKDQGKPYAELSENEAIVLDRETFKDLITLFPQWINA